MKSNFILVQLHENNILHCINLGLIGQADGCCRFFWYSARSTPKVAEPSSATIFKLYYPRAERIALSMMDPDLTPPWIPDLSRYSGAKYLAFVEALAADIETGALRPGIRLLPQRDMAQRLGLSVGTVSKAYAEAEARGLTSGEVGRGTFVQGRKSSQPSTPSGTVNLALNVPPSTGEDEVIRSVLSDILVDGGLDGLLDYLPHQGLRHHRTVIARWLETIGVRTAIDNLFITNGGQHAISIALSLLAPPSAAVLTERFTYSGMMALALQNGYRLHGVAGDAAGLLPDALDRAFRETAARVVFVTPTLQTPTGTVMPADRRREIADVVRTHDAYIVEDDVYAFLCPVPPVPLVALAPERSFYVTSFAKCLAPGLRIGGMVAPEAFRDRCINAVRATGWMASPVMAEAVTRLVHSGDLMRQVILKREKAATRCDLADRVLGSWMPRVSDVPGFHRWLPLPAGRSLDTLVAQAAQGGITLAPPGPSVQVEPGSLGIRICLGHPANEAPLERALKELRSILENAEAFSYV